VPDHLETGRLGRLVQGHAARADLFRLGRDHRRRGGTGRNRAVVLVDQRQKLGGAEIADHHQHCVVGGVVGAVVGHDLVAAPVLDVAHPADHRPVIGMGHDRRGAHGLVEQAGVVVLHAHAAFGGDHSALGFEHLGIEDESLHAVSLNGHHLFEGRDGKPVGVGGHVIAGIGVVGAAVELHDLVELAGTGLGRAVEHHVLDEMGDPGQPRPLVARADTVKGIVGDVGDGMVLEEEDLEAVVEFGGGDVLLAEGRRQANG